MVYLVDRGECTKSVRILNHTGFDIVVEVGTGERSSGKGNISSTEVFLVVNGSTGSLDELIVIEDVGI